MTPAEKATETMVNRLDQFLRARTTGRPKTAAEVVDDILVFAKSEVAHAVGPAIEALEYPTSDWPDTVRTALDLLEKARDGR